MASNNTSAPTTSSPSLQSLRAVSGSNRMPIIFLAVLVLSGLFALGLSCLFLMDNKVKSIKAVETREAEAKEVKPINAQPIHNDDYRDRASQKETDDEKMIYFNLFTTPDGADVYRDGVYIGTTPIENKKFARSDEQASFAVLLDGYDVERFNISLDETLDETFSQQLTLKKSVVAMPTLPSSSTPKPVADGVVANKAVVITDTDSKAKQHKGKSKKDKPSQDLGFVLPD